VTAENLLLGKKAGKEALTVMHMAALHGACYLSADA
jgi:hypothetical protein